jgi:hypothetical protein
MKEFAKVALPAAISSSLYASAAGVADGSLVAVAAGVVGVVGAAVVGLYQRFSAAGLAAESARLKMIVESYEARLKTIDRDRQEYAVSFEDRVQVLMRQHQEQVAALKDQIADVRADVAIWRSRYESAIGSPSKDVPRN